MKKITKKQSDEPFRQFSDTGLNNSVVESARYFGSKADLARNKALEHKPGSDRRGRLLGICRVWAIAEARMRSIVENRIIEPDYKRIREPYPPF